MAPDAVLGRNGLAALSETHRLCAMSNMRSVWDQAATYLDNYFRS